MPIKYSIDEIKKDLFELVKNEKIYHKSDLVDRYAEVYGDIHDRDWYIASGVLTYLNAQSELFGDTYKYPYKVSDRFVLKGDLKSSVEYELLSNLYSVGYRKKGKIKKNLFMQYLPKEIQRAYLYLWLNHLRETKNAHGLSCLWDVTHESEMIDDDRFILENLDLISKEIEECIEVDETPYLYKMRNFYRM